MTMTVATTPVEMRDEYLARVEDLYIRARGWANGLGPNVQIEEESITLREEPVKPYHAKVLVIKRPSYKTVRLVPRGRWIIGAEGRVDMESDLGTETLLYVSDGDPTIRAGLLTENGKFLDERKPQPDATDVAKGWVFIQNRWIGMLPSLDAELFHRLLEVLGR